MLASESRQAMSAFLILDEANKTGSQKNSSDEECWRTLHTQISASLLHVWQLANAVVAGMGKLRSMSRLNAGSIAHDLIHDSSALEYPLSVIS